MATVVVDRRGASLEHQGRAIVVRLPEEKPRTIPLHLIERVVIAAAVQIEASLLTHLAEHGIGVLVLPARGHRRSSHLHAFGHGDVQRRIGQYRLIGDRVVVRAWAERFVRLRLLGQIRLLCRILTRRPDRRRAIHQGLETIRGVLERIEHVPDVEVLRGSEGAATRAFFAAYREAFAPTLEFTGRNRRPPRDPVNAALSLGYTLVHGDAVQAIVKGGLDPMLGFLHTPDYSRESLACDYAEIARSRVEYLVWRLFAEQTLRAQQFKPDGGGVRMDKAARAAFFGAYEPWAQLHRRWFVRYTRLVVGVTGDGELSLLRV